jgi:hypothetical protein
VLIDVARLLQHETYSGELVARYGGEEFVILCPATELDQAHRRAERLRLAIPEAKIEGVPNYRITASFGVTEVEPGDTPESILKRADEALYTAKNTGRNRTVTRQSSDSPTPEQLAEEEAARESADPFTFTTTFHACVTSKMIVFKLGGFVDETKGNLIDVSDNKAEIRIGSTGLLPFWGATPNKQPVVIQVEFNHDADPRTERRGASQQAEVNVTIRPIGRIKNPEVFQRRANEVMKLLRSFFLAD